jgi:tRNA(Arg) A34 adenosine deaminase TadA
VRKPKPVLVVARTYDKRGVLLACRSNSYSKTHPLQAHFAKLVGRPASIFLHAEIHAIVASGDRKIYRIEVERFNSEGEPALARPCLICQAAIEAYEIEEVYYT